MTTTSAYEAAEETLRVPPIRRRGLENENPPELGFWQLLREDFETHDDNPFERGFWAVATHRFGNWRLGLKSSLLRVPCSLAYDALERGIDRFGGIQLPCTTKLGRRVRLWHHGGMIIGARAIGCDVQIRQNTTIGVAHAWREEDLPIIEEGVDIGCGVSILGPVVVGRGAKLGANAVILEDVPEGATAIGNPARVHVARAPEALNGAHSNSLDAGSGRADAEPEERKKVRP